ncbi:light harvesting protein [Emiliania huxleyi CCMP1516]|jgi:light-harvesting complex II chlorophyll a/b binding protein 4|uniref:Light harvesting protein n=2 Tax=Emiliania huxleyi TaxID=2903 RepID=A0A0D3IFZ6_EMIH1|nr:light harvesting protein [Emiliania huxleyi CCMP1516]XP_005784380.1 light harvesting protein [Emiliania huxleyi CCMP1516]EOD10181.1 light harvesting protein [Emiliania huxleyi CCMP1516]EOD31951.1 light harvesting protein [Emiliania huxleyi CCMP1516]|eukprot:XP_005762610.1 light harvesting protein [Emiliania huxleyi CCMP1516]
MVASSLLRHSALAARAAPATMQQAGKLEAPIPWLPRPDYLDGTLAADAGFDPLKFAEKYREGIKINVWLNPETGLPFSTATSACKPNTITLGPSTSSTKRSLAWMREAEIKHARLAMLAAAGWPLAELWHGAFSNLLGMPFALEVTQGRSLSVLNGGLGEVWPFLLLVAIGTSAIECRTLDQVHGLTATGKTMRSDGQVVMKSYVPGDCGFDPLGLYNWFGANMGVMDKMYADNDPGYALRLAEYHRKEMETAELKNGRLAMLAITGYAFQEALYGTPVVDQTPLFFTFFGDVLAPGALQSLGLF